MGGGSSSNLSSSSVGLTSVRINNSNRLSQNLSNELISKTITNTLQSQSSNLRAFVTQKNTIGGTGATNCPGGSEFTADNIKQSNVIKIGNQQTTESNYATNLENQLQADVAIALYNAAANSSQSAISTMLGDVSKDIASSAAMVAGAVVGTAGAVAGGLNPFKGDSHTNVKINNLTGTFENQKNEQDITTNIDTKLKNENISNDANKVVQEFMTFFNQSNDISPNNYCKVKLTNINQTNLVDIISNMTSVATMANHVTNTVKALIREGVTTVSSNRASAAQGEVAAIASGVSDAAYAMLLGAGTGSSLSGLGGALSGAGSPTNLLIIGGVIISIVVIIVIMKIMLGGSNGDNYEEDE